MSEEPEYYFWKNESIRGGLQNIWPYENINDILKAAEFLGEVVPGPAIELGGDGKPQGFYRVVRTDVGIGLYVHENSTEKYSIDKSRSTTLAAVNFAVFTSLAR